MTVFATAYVRELDDKELTDRLRAYRKAAAGKPLKAAERRVKERVLQLLDLEEEKIRETIRSALGVERGAYY